VIRITRQTDYGIILLTFLAGRPLDLVHTARDVAEAAGLPLPMVSKILKVLAREGLLVTKRGVKGGYSLAAAPAEITLAQVIRALEGPIGMTECSSAPGSCDREHHCPVRVNWQRISGAVRDALDKIPLSEMVGVPAGAGLLAVGDPVAWPAERAGGGL
jgi:FeS assembly SUF system regulator